MFYHVYSLTGEGPCKTESSTFGPAHEKKKTDLMVVRFVVLQMRTRSPLLRLKHAGFFLFCFFLAWSFLNVPSTGLRTTKALTRLRLCAVSPEPLLVAYVISTISSCAGLFFNCTEPRSFAQTGLGQRSFHTPCRWILKQPHSNN